jgi:hypothetical protein
MKRVLLVLTLMIVAVPQAYGWGEAGHYMVAEAATLTLPNDMPSFFYEAFPDLIWLSYDPDRRRGAGESLDAVSGPDHYLDYEYVSQLELPASRYAYIAAMESSGIIRRRGLTYGDVGFLPWRMAEMSEMLTEQWRNWRNMAGSDRRSAESAIVNTAGLLGHYLADAANPHHTTINHNGWILPNPNRYPIDCGTHARFETVFVSHAVETSEILPAVAAPKLREADFAESLEFVKASNALVETMYRIDRDGGFDFIGRPPAIGKQFAVDRLAAGASMLRDVWWSAWKNSAKPVRRGE